MRGLTMTTAVMVCCASLPGRVSAGGVVLGAGIEAAPGVIAHFEVTGRSRLAALAMLGGEAQVSLLVEAGELGFLEAPVTVSMDRFTVEEGVTTILRGTEEYGAERRGAVVVAVPRRPARPLNRLLGLRMGRFAFAGTSISMLDPYLGYLIREATGCHPGGFAWAGASLDLAIPPFTLPDATFEGVVERVAMAPEPTMWVVRPDDGGRGCMNDAANQWEVGFYRDREYPGEMPFRMSVGPMMVR